MYFLQDIYIGGYHLFSWWCSVWLKYMTLIILNSLEYRKSIVYDLSNIQNYFSSIIILKKKLEFTQKKIRIMLIGKHQLRKPKKLFCI
jgi:hypothetical protein